MIALHSAYSHSKGHWDFLVHLLASGRLSQLARVCMEQCPADLGAAELALLGTAAFLVSNQTFVLQCQPLPSPGNGRNEEIVSSLSELRQR